MATQPIDRSIATLTDAAVKKVRDALKGRNDIGVRLTVLREAGEFKYKFDYVAAGQADPRDFVFPCGEYQFYIHWDSEALIKGSTIDYSSTGMGEAWVIDNPNPAWDSALAAEISKVFNETINPGLAEHGGHIKLVGIKENIVYVEMSGGCQGCSMAGKTLHHGVIQILAERFPQITGLVDV
ncbi:MAG TPA: NifU family protein, partial [Candidatus Manganitrophaceae bacterium]|nr:NifU family protein [Candidatus Manganitrophaceae bacterium]